VERQIQFPLRCFAGDDSYGKMNVSFQGDLGMLKAIPPSPESVDSGEGGIAFGTSSHKQSLLSLAHTWRHRSNSLSY